MACDVFDAFAVATESLDQDVYRNASWKSMWLNLIPRDTYKEGTGLTQTTFTINNIEPVADDEDWPAIALASGTGQGACGTTYNQILVGYDDNTYVPEQFGLKGPMLCKDDLIFDHKVDLFLRAYVQEMTKRAQRSWEKRYESIYTQYSRKVALTTGTQLAITDTIGKPYRGATGILPGTTLHTAGGIGQATSTITQDHLDGIAIELIDAGATNPDSSGFISLGDDGPIFSLSIGLDASQRIAKNNSEFRQDIRYGMPSELMKRLGAGRVIKNFRHIPNLRPPRFIYGGTLTVTTATTGGSTNVTINGETQSILTASLLTAVTNAGINIADLFLNGYFPIGVSPIIPISGTGIPASSFIGLFDGAASGSARLGIVTAAGVPVACTAAATITATVGTVAQYTRVQTHMELAATGKGKKYPINPQWKAAGIEMAHVLSPNVFTSEVIRPVNSAGGVTWNPTSYMGEWKFVRGGPNISSDCANGSDPNAKLGAHFAEFKHAPRPEFPLHGFSIFFLRCKSVIGTVTC